MNPPPSSDSATPRLRVGIVGAGFAGTALAANLLRAAAGAEVVLIERTGDFGPGVAYSTDDAHHLLNVPAARLSAWSDRPDHLLDWARTHVPQLEPGAFLERRMFGTYLRELLDEAARSASGTRLERITGEAIALTPSPSSGEIIQLADGSMLSCDAVVLALGAQPSHLPAAFPQDPRIFHSPWDPGALDRAAGGLTTLLVGTGLTAVDATLSLCASDPDARVVALSRNGQLPFAHLDPALREPAPAPPWPADPLTAAQLAETFAAHVRAMEHEGYDWRDVVDGLRPGIQSLWARLPEDEQRAFASTYSRAWEVRRHRMAPRVAARLRELRDAGRFQLRAGGIEHVDVTGEQLTVRFTDAVTGAVETVTAARVVGCTGPGLDIRDAPSPLLQQLLRDGRVSPDALHIGLRTTDSGALLAAGSAPQPHIFTLGSLRRGELWETTAVPEIRVQAEQLAAHLTAMREATQATG